MKDMVLALGERDSPLRPSHGNAKWWHSSTLPWSADAGKWPTTLGAAPVSPSLGPQVPRSGVFLLCEPLSAGTTIEV